MEDLHQNPRGRIGPADPAAEAVYWLTDMPLQFFVGFNTHEAGKAMAPKKLGTLWFELAMVV